MDILFLINFVMDIIIFIITTMILNKPLHLKKLLIGGIIAALLYCMLLIYPVLQRLPYSVYTLLVPVIPILYLYHPVRLKDFAKYYLLSTGVAALIGGASFTLWYQLQYYVPGYKPTLEFIFLIGIGVGFIVYFSFYAIRKRLVMPHFEYDLEIHYDGRMERVPALLDTGNMLYTPIGHQPVLVVTYDAIKKILEDEECKAIESCHNDVEKMMELDKGPRYIIPFHSMGCENGLLWGVMSECIVLHKGGFEKQIPKCIIGIAFGNLCSDRTYKALIHPDFIVSEGE
nr:sigma-E processing peptidase SpoIIGA [uncultured Cellulosilyticum sp.]